MFLYVKINKYNIVSILLLKLWYIYRLCNNINLAMPTENNNVRLFYFLTVFLIYEKYKK